MYAAKPAMRPIPDRASAGAMGAVGGLLGGLGGILTCLCCLSALALIGLWSAFIPLVAFFKYAYDQDISAAGGATSLLNLQQIVVLLAICLLTIGLVKRQHQT